MLWSQLSLDRTTLSKALSFLLHDPFLRGLSPWVVYVLFSLVTVIDLFPVKEGDEEHQAAGSVAVLPPMDRNPPFLSFNSSSPSRKRSSRPTPVR